MKRETGAVVAAAVHLSLWATLPAHAANEQSAAALPRVIVSAQADGTEDDGYRADTVQNVGPFGARELLDTPYALSVAPLDLIENLQASAPDQIFRINPSTQVYLPNARAGQTDVTIRGFSDPAVAEDGLRSTVFRMDIEDKERVEVLNGLSGVLFGPATPGGMVNYVLKRPTSSRYTSIEVGDTGGTNFYAHADLGGPIDEAGRFGYRVNLLAQDGDGVADDSKLQRFLVSTAFDARLTDDLLLQFDASFSSYRSEGVPAAWIFAGAGKHPRALDSSKNWGQPYTSTDDPVTKAGVGLVYRINDALTWRTDTRFVDQDQRNDLLVNNLSVANGTYLPLIFRNARFKTQVISASSMLDARFSTGALNHTLTAGVFGDITNTYQPPDRNNTAAFPPVTFDAPTSIPEPDLPAGELPRVLSNHVRHSNVFVGDQVGMGEQWSAILGANYAKIVDTARAYTDPGAPQSAAYDDSKLTPSASIVFKPIPAVSTYVTYIEGLEEGGVAPDTAANAFDVLAPIRSTQYEAGAKARVGGALLTAALFRIERPNQFLDPADNTFKEVGDEIHKGLELSVSGKVLDALTLWGGATFMHSRVADTQANPALSGKRPIGIGGVADRMAKLYAEYAVPGASGLFLTAGVYYTGSFYADALNTEELPSYTLGDIGARYVTQWAGKPTTLRLNVSNITDKDYWLSSSYLGTPRTVSFSVQTHFQ